MEKRLRTQEVGIKGDAPTQPGALKLVLSVIDRLSLEGRQPPYYSTRGGSCVLRVREEDRGRVEGTLPLKIPLPGLQQTGYAFLQYRHPLAPNAGSRHNSSNNVRGDAPMRGMRHAAGGHDRARKPQTL